MKKISTIIVLFFLSAGLFAQAPQKMSYQSVVRNVSGTLVANGNITVKISIIQGSIVGTAVFVETHSKNTNANGLVSLEIGNGIPVTGTFALINWSDGPYFIKTEVDPTGGTNFTITGVNQLLSVPYALHANKSDSASFASTSAGGPPTGNAGGDLSGTYPNPLLKVPVVKTDSIDSDAILEISNTSSVNTKGAIRAFSFSTASNATALQGMISSSSPGGFSAAVRGINNGTGGLGVGVIGTQGGSGWGVYGTAPSGIGVYGLSTSGFGVYGQSTTGASVYGIQPSNGTNSAGYFQSTNAANASPTVDAYTNGVGNAGRFQITNAANTNNGIEGTTSGTGAGVFGNNTSTTGSTSGVIGQSNSTANGVGANGGVSGVVGKVLPTAPGGYSAGVRGVNNGTGGTGIGVVGYQAGSGWGVYGETPSGFGVYGLTTNSTAVNSGVRGETFSPNGIGVEAKYSGSGVGTALEIDNGAIRIAGTYKPAFMHTATAANKLSANGTDIDNPMCNGDANCLVFVTQRLYTGVVYNNSPIGVYYNTTRSKWEIFNQNSAAIPTGAIFHVLVIKQ